MSPATDDSGQAARPLVEMPASWCCSRKVKLNSFATDGSTSLGRAWRLQEQPISPRRVEPASAIHGSKIS